MIILFDGKSKRLHEEKKRRKKKKGKKEKNLMSRRFIDYENSSEIKIYTVHS